MAAETLPSQATINQAFETPIYATNGTAVPFGSLFTDNTPGQERILVIFIRHFFCGNCQEYVRRLSSIDSPFHPSHKPPLSSTTSSTTTHFSKPAARSLPRVVIIGPGLPTLIPTYVNITACSFPVYSDPSTALYDLLGMHRTFSLGHKAPIYIQHSLITGAVKSAVQIVKRVGNGDALRGGYWNVNGGEFLFVQPGWERSTLTKSKSKPPVTHVVPPDKTKSSLGNVPAAWRLAWCHRMHNSRDHTELNELHYNTCFPLSTSLSLPNLTSSHQATSPPRSILVNANRPPQPVKSHTFPLTSLGTRSKLTASSRDCAGTCPGPDVPKSREESYSHRQRSQSPAQRSTVRLRSRSTSAGSPESRGSMAEANGRGTSMFHTSAHRHHYSRASINSSPSADMEPPQPKNGFNVLLGRVGGLVRSKSISARSKPVIDLLTPEKENGLRDDIDKSAHSARRPSTSMSTSRSRSSLSISRLGSFASKTSTPVNLVRSRSKRSRSRSNSKDVYLDDPSGTMVIDGVEFVNVLSVRARIEAAAATERTVAMNGDQAGVKDQTWSIPIMGINLASLPGSLDQRGTCVVSSMSAAPVMAAVSSH